MGTLHLLCLIMLVTVLRARGILSWYSTFRANLCYTPTDAISSMQRQDIVEFFQTKNIYLNWNAMFLPQKGDKVSVL
jgi:hypothetical protein